MEDVAWKDLLRVVDDELLTVPICVRLKPVTVEAGAERLTVHSLRDIKRLARQHAAEQHVATVAQRPITGGIRTAWPPTRGPRADYS